MTESFFDFEFHEVLVRIQSNNVPVNQIISMLPGDRERIFPTTEVSAASIRANPTQVHNARFWILSMLDKLGFICENPGLGYYKVRGEAPDFVGQAASAKGDHEGSFDLLQRCMHSLALLGFGYHSRQLFNHMCRLYFQFRMKPNQVVAYQNSFLPWCNRILFAAIIANPDQECSIVRPPNQTVPPGEPMNSFEFSSKASSDQKLQAVCCSHGLIAAPSTTPNGARVLRCRIVGANNCQFSEIPTVVSVTAS